MSVLAELERRLQDTGALITKYENALIDPENSTLKNSLGASIQSLQKLHHRLEERFLEQAAIEEQEVYKYRIIVGDRLPSLGGIAEAWSQFEKLFSTIYRKLAKADMPSPLGYSYCFPGSVGVVITLPKLPAVESAMMVGNPIEDTSSAVFDLIESKDIQKIVRELGPEPIEAANEWLSVHMRHGYGLGLEWKSNQITRRRKEIAPKDVSSLQATIIETSTDTTLVMPGELFAVDADSKTFSFRRDDGEEDVTGTFSDAITAKHTASVPSRYKATIVKTVRIGNSKKERKEKDKQTTYFLSRLDPI